MLTSVLNICVSELVGLHNLSLEIWQSASFLVVIIITVSLGLRFLYTLYYDEKEQREKLFALSDFISDSRFLIACKSGDITLVEQMIIYGANIHATNMYGESAIHMAAYYHTANVKSNDMTLLMLLVSAGCRVNVSSHTGCTPLHIAAGSGHLELVKILLFYGADKEVLPRPGKNAYCLGHYKVAKLLRSTIKLNCRR